MGRKKRRPKSPRGKRYSKEFKAGAVKLARESGMNLNQLAKQLGVSRGCCIIRIAGSNMPALSTKNCSDTTA